jgi:hypothetical protein
MQGPSSQSLRRHCAAGGERPARQLSCEAPPACGMLGELAQGAWRGLHWLGRGGCPGAVCKARPSRAELTAEIEQHAGSGVRLSGITRTFCSEHTVRGTG